MEIISYDPTTTVRCRFDRQLSRFEVTIGAIRVTRTEKKYGSRWSTLAYPTFVIPCATFVIPPAALASAGATQLGSEQPDTSRLQRNR
jgi:hypothetical protein